jgi:hypothetical protein
MRESSSSSSFGPLYEMGRYSCNVTPLSPILRLECNITVIFYYLINVTETATYFNTNSTK